MKLYRRQTTAMKWVTENFDILNNIYINYKFTDKKGKPLNEDSKEFKKSMELYNSLDYCINGTLEDKWSSHLMEECGDFIEWIKKQM